jgi:hypothetical protein
MSGVFASPLMVGGEILLGLSISMFAAAMVGGVGRSNAGRQAISAPVIQIEKECRS